MKRLTPTILGIIGTIVLAALMFWPLPELETNPSMEKLEEKNAPNDYFFFRHAYPDKYPDKKAYLKALADVRLKAKNNILPGFDNPWTLRGPGDAGGRINTVAIHPTNEQIIYAGYSGGGIFKTTDGGTTWTPIFDDQPFLAIGHITFDPSDPDIIYVGTGDPNISGYPFVGDGIYKSTDAGATWTHLGLGEAGIISKIFIDPNNSSTMYAGTMGLPFLKDNNRGLYKSTDGGSSWSQILFLSDSTGVIDLLMNPNDPQVLYAAGWDRIRNNSQSIVYGDGARIHKTTDGGATWTELGGGLPIGVYSRIGLSMSGNNPDHIFALYNNTGFNVHGIYKSTDAGQNWTEIPTDPSTGLFSNAMGGQGWYFGQLRVDPTNESRIYLLGLELWFTSSSGIGWSMVTQNSGGPVPHVDHHDLQFAPSGALVLASDGGLYRRDAGVTQWTDIENIPGTQFYRIGYNPHEPEAFYGGTQDNGTQKGTRSDVVDWERIFGGDGFQPVFHPTDPDVFYVETQNGNIWSTSNGGSGFQYASSGINSLESRSWDMQFIMSPHNPDVMYTGTDRLYLNTNGPLAQWNPVSAPLTVPPGGGNSRYYVLTTLDESPIDSALLYVGTSDGRVWRHNPDGQLDEVTTGLPNRYVTCVAASPDDAQVVFVSHSGYKDNDNIAHIHRSDDKGENWTAISGDMPSIAVNDLLVMPNYNGQVIFAGTDGGVYATLDGGIHWELLGLDMPQVAVYDVEWNEFYNELMAGTYARSIYTFPLDSIGVSGMPLSVNVMGTILSEIGAGVSGVDLSGGQSQTDINGNYSLSVFTGGGCEIVPFKNNNSDNGVTVTDLVLGQRHILLIDTLDSPYKLIAADVDDSEEIGITDLIFMQRLILLIDTVYTNNNSWRFIPGDYIFNDPAEPLSENYPESIDCSTATSDINAADFVAIKIGDVNNDASPNALPANEVKNGNYRVQLNYVDQELKVGEEIDLLLNVESEKLIHGLQLDLLTTGLEIEEVSRVELMPDSENLLWNEYAPGTLRVLWNSATGTSGSQTLMNLRLRAKEAGWLSEFLLINSASPHLGVVALGKEMEAVDLELIASNITANNSVETGIEFKAFPNPFNNDLTLQVQSNESEEIKVKMLDIQGRVLTNSSWSLNQGYNEQIIKGEELPGSGIYILVLENSSGKTMSLPVIKE